MSLQYGMNQSGTAIVLSFIGRMDAPAINPLREKILSQLEENPPNVVLDLSQLSWIDSSGVGVLISVYKRARQAGGDAKVANLQQQPKEIFRLLRLESAFTVFDSVESAVASFGNGGAAA